MRRGGRHDTREMSGTATFPVQLTRDVWHCHGSRALCITRGRRSELCVKCGRRLDTLLSLFDPVLDNMDFVASNGAQVMLRGKILSREIFSRVVAGAAPPVHRHRQGSINCDEDVMDMAYILTRELARILRQGE